MFHMPRKLLLTLILSLCFALPCLAHSYPLSEAYIGGVGPNCTMKYVQSIYGEPKSKKWTATDGIRSVTYYYSPLYQVTGRTWANHAIPEDEFPVVGYTVKANNLTTPSGITVGVPYSTVAKMYGPGQRYVEKGRVKYIYSLPNQHEISFTVNKKGIITEIYLGTDF